MRSTWIAAVLLATSEFLGAAPDAAVPYPEGYREWVHVLEPRDHSRRMEQDFVFSSLRK